jgi:hypothetical protein
MEKKTIYYVIGGIAVLGIGYYFYNKSKSSNSEFKDTEEKPVLKSEELSPDKIAEAKLATRFTASKGMSNVLDRLKTISEPVVESQQGTGIKGLRGEDRRDFREETRDVCAEKYGKGKDYRQCKRRVKDGGSAFEGDFEGTINSQFMFSEFENSLNLDL